MRLSTPIVALAALLCVAALVVPQCHAQQILATTGMTPANASAFTLSSINTTFPADVALALGLATDRVVVVSAATSGATSYNVSLNFVGSTSNTSMSLATEYMTLAVVTRDASAQYLQHLAKYNIEVVDITSMATTTTTAPTTTVLPPPPMSTNATGNNTNVTTNPDTVAPFTPAPTQVNPDNGNHTYDDVGGGGDDSNNTIYAIIFGILGVLIVVAAVTFCIKHFAKKEKKDTSKRGGGYKYATRNAQHI